MQNPEGLECRSNSVLGLSSSENKAHTKETIIFSNLFNEIVSGKRVNDDAQASQSSCIKTKTNKQETHCNNEL